MGGSGTGKSGISPSDDASDAKDEVVSGRWDRKDPGDKVSSFEFDPPYEGGCK
jgi:hypothetical protein